MSDWTPDEKLSLAMQRVRQLDAEVLRWRECAAWLAGSAEHLRKCMTCGYDPKECDDGRIALDSLARYYEMRGEAPNNRIHEP